MVKKLEHFHKYLYGQEFHLRTDHSALTWLMSFKNLNGQTARLIHHLQEYIFPSDHRQGQRHNDSNALPDDHAKKSVLSATKPRGGQTSIKY
jgi:hypothetical protein